MNKMLNKTLLDNDANAPRQSSTSLGEVCEGKIASKRANGS